MKKFLFILFTILFLCNINLVAQDSTRVEEEKNNGYEKYHAYLIGGGGVATFKHLSVNINTSLALNLGIDIPLTKAYNYSFEVMGHTWIARRLSPGSLYDESTIHINDTYMMQIGISTVLKVHFIGNKESKFRAFLHFGFMFGYGQDYEGLDGGVGLNYKISDELKLQFNNRVFFGFVSVGGSNFYTPALYLLNICYTL